MKLSVVSHKETWPSVGSPLGIATDGGFVLQMEALAELFDTTEICVPVLDVARPVGEVRFDSDRVSITALPPLEGSGLRRKLRYPAWFVSAMMRINKSVGSADLVHVPIPSDIGTAGILIALLRRKRLFIRYCGNWNKKPTRAEVLWKKFMEWRSKGTDLMLATGGSESPPSPRFPRIEWIFSTSLTQDELDAIEPPQHPPSPDDLVLVIAARQVKAKRTDVVLRSLGVLRTRFPGIRFDVVGDGPDLDAFRSLAEELGVADITNFHGKLDHRGVMEVLRNSHIFVMPTESEGFPKSVVEALACGLPVVATSVSVIPQLVSGAGVLFEQPTVDLVVDAITEITSDPDRYMEMSKQSRSNARGYTLEAWRDRIEELLGQQPP